MRYRADLLLRYLYTSNGYREQEFDRDGGPVPASGTELPLIESGKNRTVDFRLDGTDHTKLFKTSVCVHSSLNQHVFFVGWDLHVGAHQLGGIRSFNAAEVWFIQFHNRPPGVCDDPFPRNAVVEGPIALRSDVDEDGIDGAPRQ